MVMGAMVVAPTEVKPDSIRGNVSASMVEQFNSDGDLAPKFIEIEQSSVDVPAHREVRSIELEDEASRNDRFVFDAHSLGDCFPVFLVRRIVLVFEVDRDDARGRGRHKKLSRRQLFGCRSQIGNIFLESGTTLINDRPGTCGGLRIETSK